jgi:hypothetical protein
MKTRILRWGSVVSAVLSATWVVLLAALVVRCIATPEPFPVLAKFSPFPDHLKLVDRFLSLFPVFALLALLLAGGTWYWERNFRSIHGVLITTALLLLVSLGVIIINPGGYLSWFLS